MKMNDEGVYLMNRQRKDECLATILQGMVVAIAGGKKPNPGMIDECYDVDRRYLLDRPYAEFW
jgi:hypothetical protein